MVFKLSQTVALAFSLAAAVQAQSGSGRTTRYWLAHNLLFVYALLILIVSFLRNRDCCKPSCSWSGKAQVNQPVQSCNAQGSKLTDANARSGCDGGGAFACTDNSPWAINSGLAYGFAAVSISGSNEGAWCCECYELTYVAWCCFRKYLCSPETQLHERCCGWSEDGRSGGLCQTIANPRILTGVPRPPTPVATLVPTTLI